MIVVLVILAAVVVLVLALRIRAVIGTRERDDSLRQFDTQAADRIEMQRVEQAQRGRGAGGGYGGFTGGM